MEKVWQKFPRFFAPKKWTTTRTTRNTTTKGDGKDRGVKVRGSSTALTPLPGCTDGHVAITGDFGSAEADRSRIGVSLGGPILQGLHVGLGSGRRKSAHRRTLGQAALASRPH